MLSVVCAVQCPNLKVVEDITEFSFVLEKENCRR
jgi:hypothetical protein